MINYCIIGTYWGKRIYKILKNLNKKVHIFKTNKIYNSKEYFKDLKNFIIKNNISIVWIATPPQNRFRIINFCLNQKVNLVVEKPIILKKDQLKKLQIKIKFKQKYCFVHFEYIFLNKLKKISIKNIKLIKMHFRHIKKNKHKINPVLNNGAHLASIKEVFFKKIKRVKYFVTEGKKNLRLIEIVKPNTKIKIDFTNNKEKIIQKFIFYLEDILKHKKKNKIDLNLGFKCTKIMSNSIKIKL